MPLLLLAVLHCVPAAHDVLMIAVDDLRPDLSCTDLPGYQKPKLYTPNICALARDSLVLQRSQVAMATCSPSRAALLTGRHPGTTHVWDLYSYFRVVGGNFTTIPQYFKERGYLTAGMGKIFHHGHASGKGNCSVCRGDNDGSYSWTEPYFTGKPLVDVEHERSWMAVPKAVTEKMPLWDTQIVQHALAVLHNIGSRRREGQDARRFFVAMGFHKPHLPFVFPEAYLDHYPQSAVSLPSNPFAPAGMPSIAWQSYGETRAFDDVAATGATGAIDTTLPDPLVLDLRRAYYAAVSYTDANVGLVLESLEHAGLANGTIVTFWGDHGWHLGEHGEWDKHTNFALNTHAPLFFRVPGHTDGGITSYELAETVDIFPTLAELAYGDKVPICPEHSSGVALCTEGVSLGPLISAPARAIKRAAFSVYARPVPNDTMGAAADESHQPRPPCDAEGVEAGISFVPRPSPCLDQALHGVGCVMGYSMMTRLISGSLLRYTEWVLFPGPSNGWKPLWSRSYGTELYNHTNDPAENINVFDTVRGTAVASALSAQLHKGWRANFD